MTAENQYTTVADLFRFQNYQESCEKASVNKER